MSYPVSMSMEELEASVGQPETPVVETPKPEAESVVSAASATPSTDALREALRISEEARGQLAQQLHGQPQQQFQQQIQQPKWYSREELAEMLNSDDPSLRFQALEINTNQALAVASQHLEARLAPLAAGTFSAARADASTRYAREFALFGGEIDNLLNNLPDKSQLTTASGWDNLISYVRGRPGNIDKYVEAINKSTAETAQQVARDEATRMMPFSPMQTISSVAPRGGQAVVVDDVTREIARGLGYTSVDAYLKDVHNYNKNSYNG